MYPFDWTFILLIPAALLAMYAQFKVSYTFDKYSKVRSSSNYTGAHIARKLLDDNGLRHVSVSPIQGKLSDHYDPRDKSLHLSEEVYNSNSMAAIGVVAHEVGHAVQDVKSYVPLKLRSGLVPVSNLGSQLSIPLFFLGLVMGYGPLMDIGIIFFTIAVAFTVVTLPVEFNASSRALAMIKGMNTYSADEVLISKKVLGAAALTYVASTAMAVLQLLRLILLRSSRND
jgi:Zn-dependent membrane protease YugP